MGLVWVPPRHETRDERLRRKIGESIRSLKWFFALPLSLLFFAGLTIQFPEPLGQLIRETDLYKALFFFWGTRQIIRFLWI